jgi:outer membrane autotransporter protein
LAANGTPAGAETAFIAGVAANQSYLNIHSATFPGGEIRGFLVLQKFASNPNLSVRTTGVAGALDSLGAGTGAVSDALVALTALSPAQQAAALELLTPIASRGTLVAASSSLDTTFDQLSNHLDGLRSPVAPAVAQTDNGLWLMGHGINRHQKLEDGFAGYKGDGWGVVGGIDHAIAPGAFIGAAVSYSDSSLDYRDQLSGSSDDIKSTQVSLYGSQDTGQIYIEGMLAYAWQKYDGDRNTGVAGIATGDYNGHQWGARFGGGMPIALAPNASITPQAHLSWDEVKQDAFTETGGALALAVASRSADRFRSSIGAQVDFDAGMADIKTRLFVRGFWHHDFKNDGIVTTASFVAGGTSFVTPGQELDSDPFTVGAGINFYGQGSFSAALTYDLTLGNSYQSHVFEAKARVAF